MTHAVIRLAACALALLAAPLCAQSPDETYKRALDAESEGDYAATRRLHQQACNAENARACRELVVMHLKGRGGPQSDSAARSMAEKVCRLGSIDGCAILMQFAYIAKGGPKDLPLVKRMGELICKPKEGGDPLSSRACYFLGLALIAQEPVDRPAAENAFSLACRGSMPRACFELSAFYFGMHGGPRDREKALRFTIHSCIRGLEDVCEKLAIETDPIDLRKKSTEACEEGDEKSCLDLDPFR